MPRLYGQRRAHRNRLLPISTHFGAKVGQARLWCTVTRTGPGWEGGHASLLPTLLMGFTESIQYATAIPFASFSEYGRNAAE